MLSLSFLSFMGLGSRNLLSTCSEILQKKSRYGSYPMRWGRARSCLCVWKKLWSSFMFRDLVVVKVQVRWTCELCQTIVAPTVTKKMTDISRIEGVDKNNETPEMNETNECKIESNFTVIVCSFWMHSGNKLIFYHSSKEQVLSNDFDDRLPIVPYTQS